MSLADERRLARLEASLDAAAAHASDGPAPAKPTPLAFVQSLKIVDKDSGRTIPFRLWPAQRKLLHALATNDRLVVLKARQLGISYLCLSYLLFCATFEPGQLFLVARQSLEEAGEAVHRLRQMNETVPVEWRQEAITDNVFSLGFANGSRIRALSSTKRMGRGLAARYVIADEVAFYDAPEEQIAALEPGAKRLHVISTGNGPGDFFHSLYLEALTGRGRWRARFLSWKAAPSRDRAWWAANVEQSPSPALARREYAETPEEAFASRAGRYWERFDSTRNVAEVDVVPAWRTYRAVDFGYRNSACVWAQVTPTGQLFIVSELLPKNTTTREFAEQILARDKELGVTPAATHVDPAGRSVNVQTSESEVEIFRQAGLRPTSRPSGIRDGCVRLTDLIADPAIPLVVSTACPQLVKAFTLLRPDKHSPEVYDETSDYCHVTDATRYLVVNLRQARTSSGSISTSLHGVTRRRRREW
jgi:hypothetical protein